MKLSIILPVYNVENYLKDCMDSIIQQIKNKNDTEVILVDDGSVDKSPVLCDYYSEIYTNIRVIHQENAGTGKARNRGIHAAQGEYLYFVDPDDLIGKNCVYELLKLTNKNAEMVIFGYWNVDYQTKKITEKNLSFDMFMDKRKFKQNFVSLFEKDMLYTVWNKLYKKDFLIKNELFFASESMGQDTRFNLRVYKQLSSVYICDKRLYYYVQNRNGSSTTRYRQNRFKLKTEEAFLVKNLLDKLGIKNDKFLLNYYRKILLESVFYISNSKLSKIKQKQSISEVYKSEVFLYVQQQMFRKKFIEKFLYSKQSKPLFLILKVRRWLKLLKIWFEKRKL